MCFVTEYFMLLLQSENEIQDLGDIIELERRMASSSFLSIVWLMTVMLSWLFYLEIHYKRLVSWFTNCKMFTYSFKKCRHYLTNWKFFIWQQCPVLKENGAYRLIYKNTWFTVGRTVWDMLECGALLNEVCPWKGILRFQKTISFQIFLSLPYGCI